MTSHITAHQNIQLKMHHLHQLPGEIHPICLKPSKIFVIGKM